MDDLICVLRFLDQHSGLISAVGLLIAATGLILTLIYLQLYRRELGNQGVEQERLAWERILKLLHQVAKYAADANLSSVTHSKYAKGTGYLPPDLAARYGPASENLLSYWHQLKVEMDIMPDSDLIGALQEFVPKYESADSRASDQFMMDLTPIVHKVANRARKSFQDNASPESNQGNKEKPMADPSSPLHIRARLRDLNTKAYYLLVALSFVYRASAGSIFLKAAITLTALVAVLPVQDWLQTDSQLNTIRFFKVVLLIAAMVCMLWWIWAAGPTQAGPTPAA
jgi:hypothetical protein